MDIARNVALENCLGLGQVHKSKSSEFLVNQGVKVGAARRFVTVRVEILSYRINYLIRKI